MVLLKKLRGMYRNRNGAAIASAYSIRFFTISLFLGLIIAAFGIACSRQKQAPPSSVSADPRLSPASFPQATVYHLDQDLSKIQWSGSEEVGGTTHRGELRFREGRVFVKDQAVVAAEFVVDMTYIRVLDMPTKSGRKLQDHLKSADFFHVEKYPQARFTLSAVGAADTMLGGNALVEGKLTLRGVTQPVQIPLTLGVNDDFVTVTSPEFTIDRTRWGVSYRSSVLGAAKDEAISDLLGLRLRIRANSPEWLQEQRAKMATDTIGSVLFPSN